MTLHFLIKFCTIASLEFLFYSVQKTIFKNSFSSQYIKV